MPIELTDALATLLKSHFQARASGFFGRLEVDYCDLEALPTLSYTTDEYRPARIEIDKSLRLTADQLEVDVPVVYPSAAPGWGPDSRLQKNARIRCYQGYGDPANEVLVFTGLIDTVTDARDPGHVTVQARDMMALLLDQTFSTSAPQAAGEAGAVRTPANGVYLTTEVSDIVDAILDEAGWPSADRDVVPTSYVLDEYIVADGSSWAEAIVGPDRLSGLVGYEAYADELGVFHFAPALATSSVTELPVADYIVRSGEDVVSLQDQNDQLDLRTRVKTRGPLTTQVLTDEWRELWRTSKIHSPVGVWYDPTDATHLRVVDSGTNRLYKLRQSDRVVVSSVSVAAICPHPLGLSGDPADSSVYWLLNAPWIDGITGGNRVKKVRKSDNHVLASHALPDGHISAIKVSASYLYFTRLDTDRVYQRSKSTGGAVDDFRHTYNATLQSNPSGLMIDGTTLMVFWANGGSTARFLHCEEGALGTITKVTKTAGTQLHGGEMDTTTHTSCYGDSDTLHLVAKFSLVAVADRTDEVFSEVVDTDLEDALGALAQSEPRVHDTHPLDAAHPYEVRRDTVDLQPVLSLAQAHDTAARRLELLGRFRRVVDVGLVGIPVLQKTDVLGVVDPISGLNDLLSLDTYRTSMDANGTYVGVAAGVPIPDLVAEAGDIDDEGEGTEDPPEPIVDLNYLYGTDTDGGSTAGLEFHTPSNANDSDVVGTPASYDDSNTFSDSGVHSAETITRRLKADLGTPFAVSTMSVWSENFDGGDPNLTVDHSDDGVSWTPVAGYGYVNTLVSGEINKQEISFDEVTAQWWRISSSQTYVSLGFFTDMHVWTWAIWGSVP